ncbi:DDE-type integrase/transposase/recombinase [Megasphaera cerevisiae]|jgi:putative transposase|uniref:DDE-type integrase/transposase/recombinase n=1 Tax=Megasphaera cerevisiae TaxID=39029 RepID=UPI0009427D13|nr:hypothetical protein BSR42_11070 [Megasphaera cerevisiae]
MTILVFRSIDITYLPMKRRFLYLTVAIDWDSRCIVVWELDNMLDTRIAIHALRKAFRVDKPLILNSDGMTCLRICRR